MVTTAGLAAHFAPIGYTGAGEPTLAVLRELHARHPARIAFEALDPFLRRPVEIDPAAIQAKLVHGRRGGYCFEQSALFHDALAVLGFSVAAPGARGVGGTCVNLLNACLSVRSPDGAVEQRALADARDLGDVLERIMGLDLPAPAEAIWARLPSEPVPPWP